MNPATQPAATDMARVRENDWRSAVWLRMRTLFWLKLMGVTAFVCLFFVGYFHLLRYPSAAVSEMPLTAFDRWIAFEPLALGPYLSLWLYVGIAPGLMANLRQLLHCGLWAAALCATGLALFYLWPTAVPVHIQPGSIELLRGLDAAGNACPSMHVATAAFSLIWIDHVLRGVGAPAALRAANGLWFVAIVYSTLAIKQHVLIDVLAGLALGLLFAWMSLRGRTAAEVPRL